MVGKIDNNLNCVICREDIQDNTLVLDCMHLFHKMCIEEWERFSRDRRCPICRTPYTVTNLSNGTLPPVPYLLPTDDSGDLGPYPLPLPHLSRQDSEGSELGPPPPPIQQSASLFSRVIEAVRRQFGL